MEFRKNLPSRMTYQVEENGSRITFWVATDGELMVNVYKDIDDVSHASVTHSMDVAKVMALRDFLNGILPIPYALQDNPDVTPGTP
jgi:hypothetical protein